MDWDTEVLFEKIRSAEKPKLPVGKVGGLNKGKKRTAKGWAKSNQIGRSKTGFRNRKHRKW